MVKKSLLTFGLFDKFISNFSIITFLNNSSFFKSQWLKNMKNIEIVLIANIQHTIKNMSVELALL